MTDVAFMQSFLRSKEISKDQENNEQENFYRFAWGGGGYKEKFVQGKMFCTDRFMSSSRGENQRTFVDAGNFFYILYNVCHCQGLFIASCIIYMGKCLYVYGSYNFFPLICIGTHIGNIFIKEMKITIIRLIGTACGVYIPHKSKVGEGKEYPVDHVKSEYEKV